MLFEGIAVIDAELACRRKAYVGVKDGHIAYLSDEAPDEELAASFGEAYDGTGKLLIPAFYDAHAHAPMTLLRGYAENYPLQEWLFNHIFPFEAKITGEDCYWGTLLACAEMARYGVVGFSDMYYHIDKCCQAVLDAGIKANISDMLFESLPAMHAETFPTWEPNERLLEQWHGAGNGRVLIDCNVHSEYTTTPAAIKEVVGYARRHGLRMQVHVSETRLEHEECQGRRDGMTPVQYLESLGVFDVPCTAAHCVWVSPEDMEILARKGVFVAANPASNMKLGSGFAPYPAMLEAGVALCLGTDGMASNNNHDMLQDMLLLALVSKGATLNPAVLTPEQAFTAATRTGALSQGRADCGLIAEGMRADLCVLDITGPSWWPMINPLVNLVYAGHGSDVVLTMCDGRVVYRDGAWPTIDVEEAKRQVQARYERIVSELVAEPPQEA